MENKIVKSSEEIRYNSYGQEVKLTKEIVRNTLVKGNASVSDSEIVRFISICKFNGLNPFLNEAYLVPYNGSAQMIVSKEALMKRAELCPEYDGLQAGLIVKKGEEITELEGAFLPAGSDLLGAWAKVYRKDRKLPFYSRISFSEYSSGIALWKSKPCTMIRKVAVVQALREAFPSQLNAMYCAEEQGLQDDITTVQTMVEDENIPEVFEPITEQIEDKKTTIENAEEIPF